MRAEDSGTSVSGVCFRRPLGLGRHKRCHRADQHQRRHGEISQAPRGLFVEAGGFDRLHQKKRAGGGNQHADAVGGDVGGHSGGLFVFRKAFDASVTTMSCVADAVATKARRARPARARGGGIARAQEYDCSHQQDLREHEPPASPSQRESSGTSIASVIGAHRNFTV